MSSLPFYNWSRVAANNATADATINWAEGQSPSSVNDSARNMMASTAAFRDDISGAIATGGTSTAYTVTSYQVFDTLAHLDGKVIAFTPHTTNGATVTLNVDSLGAKPLRAQPSVELQSGVLSQGTPYAALYNNSDGAFYLFGVGPAPGIPLGAGMDYWGATAPSSAFVFPIGQTLSTTTYASLFSLFGTTYNTGGESAGTFRLPNKTGRVSAMKEASATNLTGTGWSGDSTVLGSASGVDSVTLTTSTIPALIGVNVSGTVSLSGSASFSVRNFASPGSTVSTQLSLASNAGTDAGTLNNGTSSVSGSVSLNGTTTNSGGGNAHKNVQPTIICNYIIRVI